MAREEKKISANLVIGILLLGPLLFVLIFQHFLGRPQDDLPRDQLEQQTGVVMPGNSRELRSLRYGFDTVAYYIRFEVPAGDVDSWLESNGFSELTESPIPRHLGAAIERDWWDPPRRGLMKDLGDRQVMLVSEGGDVRVYLFVKKAESP